MATAAGRAGRETMSPTDACQAGFFSAVPQPIRKVNARSSHGVSHPKAAQIVSAADTSSMKPWAHSMMIRRS